MQLNAQQKKVVNHKSGPLLVVAGAGTGKTTTIIERIKYLITHQKVSPNQIFTASFTQKSAEEMIQRLDTIMPLGYEEPWIGTFHSLCDRLLKEEGLEIGLDLRYKILTPTDQWILLKENIFNLGLNYFLPLGNPSTFISALANYFSRAQDEFVSPEKLLDLANKKIKNAKDDSEKEEAEKLLELAGAYEKYEQIKVSNSVLDFGDLIIKSIKLLNTRKSILTKYQKQFTHVLIDEFQDTNFAQYQLIKLLAPQNTNPNLLVVGDDDQCLPGTAKIHTKKGEAFIKNIKVGDEVLCGAGRSHTTFSRVSRVFKTKKKSNLIKITTKSGKKITTTDNHKMFCYLQNNPKSRNITYVYLMHQTQRGWRIGITKNILQRLRLERHINSIQAIKACKSETEARYYEALYSLKYGIPTVNFSPRPNQAIANKLLDKLLNQIDTNEAVRKLADDINIDISKPHMYADGINRDKARRVNIQLHLCHRNYSSKFQKNGFIANPTINHSLQVETSNKETINNIISAGFSMTKAKKGQRLRIRSKSLKEITAIAEKIKKITNGNLIYSSNIAKRHTQSVKSYIIPAKNILPGMFVPVLKERKLVNEEVIKVETSISTKIYYDLEIENCHNYIADNIAVHNSIYKFRGAAISNILGFKNDYPKTKEVVLTHNYRSVRKILDSSYALIQHNNPDRLEHILKIDKKLISHNTKKSLENPIIIQAQNGELEIDFVVEKIINLVAKEDYSYKDFAILSRANANLDLFVSAFKRAGIPYQRIGNRGLFDQIEIRELIHFIFVLCDPNDSVSLFHFMHFEPFSIKSELILNLIQTSKTQSKSLWEIIKESKEASIIKLVSLIQDFQNKSLKENTTNILHQFIISSGYISALAKVDSIENHLKIQNINLFFDLIKRYESSKSDTNLVSFVDTLKSWQEAGENPAQAVIEDIDTVNLLTIHASKGLEFPVVFVPSIISGRFPSISRKDKIEFPDELIGEILPKGSGHLEEERRLLYVAMTRAKDYLFLSFSPDYGGVRKRKPSGFLKETTLDEKLINSSDTKQVLKLLKETPVKATYLDQKGEIKITSLSYTQIDTFKGCPLKYKYRYILKVPTLPYQTLTFGRTIHETLHDFHRFAQQGKNLSQKELIELYKSHFDETGYDSQEHKEKRFKKGIEDLKIYYQTHQKLFGKPIHLERSFKLKIDDVIINGKIDRIDEVSDGTEIIDYKTGKTKDQKAVDKDGQLSLYALACNQVFGLNPHQVSLYFIESGKKISTSKTPKQLENTKEKLSKDIQKIKSSDFKATPNPVRCKFCEYNRICPFAIK
jgi:DNA helicase-2/ATP-dependent DNA helicase PcrA